MAHIDTESDTTRSPSQPETGISGRTETHPSEAKAEAREMAGEIKHEMQRLKDEVKQRGESLLKEQRNAAAAEVGGIAEALHRAAQQLSEREQSTTARYVDRAAETLDRMVDSVREGDLRTVLRKTEDFARRNPGVFFGGSLLAGLMLSRFLKSSAERRAAEPGYSAMERPEAGARYTH